MSDAPEKSLDQAAHPDAGEAHSEIHLPPNSFAPVCVALSLSLLFVGLLAEIRNAVGPVMWIVGLLALIASCASWARSARSEYKDLPEEWTH